MYDKKKGQLIQQQYRKQMHERIISLSQWWPSINTIHSRLFATIKRILKHYRRRIILIADTCLRTIGLWTKP